MDRFGPAKLPIVSRRPVMVLTEKQFILWNALSVGWNLLEIFDDGAFGGFPYKLPDNNCINWTDKAVATALLVGATPF